MTKQDEGLAMQFVGKFLAGGKVTSKDTVRERSIRYVSGKVEKIVKQIDLIRHMGEYKHNTGMHLDPEDIDSLEKNLGKLVADTISILRAKYPAKVEKTTNLMS